MINKINKMYLFYLLIFLLIFLYIINYTKKEAFTPKIKQFYRPYIRKFNGHYESFVSSVTNIPNIIIKQLKKINLW